MISLLSPLLPVAQMLDVPVLDFDAYLKLQDSQDVAKEAWQNRMPLINRSDTKSWFLRGLFQLFVRLGGRDCLISTCSLLINMCTLVAKRLQAEAPTSSDMGIAHTKAIRIILTTFGASISDMSAVT